MKTKILNWLANGDVGISSKTIAFGVLGIEYKRKNHPLDPDDFNRCLLLVEKIPEIKKHFNKIACLSVEWEKLINNWDRIKKSFIDEVGLNWSIGTSAPKTYNLMQAIYKKEMKCVCTMTNGELAAYYATLPPEDHTSIIFMGHKGYKPKRKKK
jgi:hypothetical protein